MNIYSIPPLLTLCSFAGLALLALVRGDKTPVNKIFFILCILASLLYADILCAFNLQSAKTALLISRIDHFFIVYMIPCYIHFFHLYCKIEKRKLLIYAAYCYAFILMCFTPTPLYIESMRHFYFGFFAKGGAIFPLFGIGSLFVTVYVLIILSQAIRNEKNNLQKNRLKYLLLGFGIMGVMNGLNIVTIFGVPLYPPGNFSFIPLIIFAVGLFKHDLLDMGVLVRKSLIYSLLTASLTCIYAFIIILADNLFRDYDLSDSVYFPFILFFIIAFVIGPLQKKIQKSIDKIFSRGKYQYRKTIMEVSRTIAAVLDLDQIAASITDTVANALLLKTCALFLSDRAEAKFINFASNVQHPSHETITAMDADSPLLQYMKKHLRPVAKTDLMKAGPDPSIKKTIAEMDALHAEIILPAIFKNRLNGFIALGEKKSEELFSAEDLMLLETLASQCALAIENARSYKLIDDLNKNLEQKVRERTKALEEALHEKEKAQEHLIRSESLAAIGQLVAGAAHELNNPLASVTSLVQSTIEDLEDWDISVAPDDDLIEDLKFANKELGRAKSIIRSLLGLSRQTASCSEAVNLNVVIQDALKILHNQYKDEDYEIIEYYAHDLPEIRSNFANLGQVVLNIIQNALQASAGTQNRIELATSFNNETNHIVFTCRDSGPGVPTSIRQDIFKPFFTTKDAGRGTGLGLYICHEIITRHGGMLTLEETAQGACFKVSLPVRRGENDQ